ncbi:MAG: PilZ domain-containing protein [Deltaproteobacteria bacterium]|nr:PilZ domain-containing protein [Deltaproteobacteria bacterium]
MRGDDPRRDFVATIEVELRREDGGLERARAVNLSPRGLCVHLRRAIEIGERVEVAFTLPPNGPEIRAHGKVVWTSNAGDLGAALFETGVHLLDLEPAASAALSEFANQPTNRRR